MPSKGGKSKFVASNGHLVCYESLFPIYLIFNGHARVCPNMCPTHAHTHVMSRHV